MRHTEQRYAAPLPLEGSFRLGEGLFDLNTYLLYFCSLMWYLPAITLICGQSQVKCINHMHTHTHMCRLHLSCINTQNTHTVKKKQCLACLHCLRGSAMNFLAHGVFDTISETAKIVFPLPLKHKPAWCYCCITYFSRSRGFFFPSAMGLLCFKFTLWLIFKFLSFLHPDSKLGRKD